jgi:FO synthase subunit 1
VRQGADAGCTEALFTFDDGPDDNIHRFTNNSQIFGHDSIHSYLQEACEIALDEGLLPHANPGNQTRAEMQSVAHLNASMGVMLETTANVAAHSGRRKKTPTKRINTIQTAGQLGVPFTSGILVGIGENWRDRAESILTIAQLHEQYGHIQEVIVQPVVENERWRGGEPDIDTLHRTVAMARVALPEDISLQVPPNLAPAGEVVDCGIDDLGGVSPVTDDHINPSYDWPELTRLRDIADNAGVPLRERLPVYEQYLPAGLRSEDFDGQPTSPVSNGTWLSKRVQAELTAPTAAGQRYRSVIRE